MRIRYERAALERAVQELKRLICRESMADGLSFPSRRTHRQTGAT